MWRRVQHTLVLVLEVGRELLALELLTALLVLLPALVVLVLPLALLAEELVPALLVLVPVPVPLAQQLQLCIKSSIVASASTVTPCDERTARVWLSDIVVTSTPHRLRTSSGVSASIVSKPSASIMYAVALSLLFSILFPIYLLCWCQQASSVVPVQFLRWHCVCQVCWPGVLARLPAGAQNVAGAAAII